jgi:hypothetical protein
MIGGCGAGPSRHVFTEVTLNVDGSIFPVVSITNVVSTTN